ncbi:MAG: hypothetical protein BMS9Abin08_1192 [Gammaproteobacteria bacterium]|nr:MAG: hypothetical protein BMS9Abin08_1192 [Gammaproteobacteria bacterium]
MIPLMRSAVYLSTILAVFSNSAMALEFGGWSELEGRVFPNDPLYEGQQQNSASAAIQPEFYQQWAGGSSFTFVPFYRYDSADDQRTHFDIREAMWLWPKDRFELRAGIGKVFWGVTEANHLVDVINQTDLIESLGGEEKLGQPMVNLTLLTDQGTLGTLDVFILPYFRERIFPGRGGRLRFDPYIDTGDEVEYEDSAREGHVDYALRYGNTIGKLDVGVSHFYGTSREPAYLTEFDSNGVLSIIPFYEIINQTGLDIQYAGGAWLWKLEAIYRSGNDDGSFYATDAGFEYTFSGAGLGGMDLGLIVEYLYDSRDFDVDTATLIASGYIGSQFNTFLNNDYMVGLRLALNDEASSEILTGFIQDIDNHASVFQLEAGRRIGDSWKAELDAYIFIDASKDPLLDFLRKDSFVQLALKYYF